MRPAHSITEVRCLCMAAKQGPNVLFRTPNRTKRILLVFGTGAARKDPMYRAAHGSVSQESAHADCLSVC
jgi:hypothetical protein